MEIIKSLEEAKEEVMKDFGGFANGHSEYMVVGVDKEQFHEWTAQKLLDPESEPMRGLSFKEGKKGITVAYFCTCEKWPGLNRASTETFPKATVYGFGEWDWPAVEAPRKAYTTSIKECFEDEGNLRIDINITDKRSGCTCCIDELVCFDSFEDVENAEEDTTYAYLTGFLDPEDKEAVKLELDKCRIYWENYEE